MKINGLVQPLVLVLPTHHDAAVTDSGEFMPHFCSTLWISLYTDLPFSLSYIMYYKMNGVRNGKCMAKGT